MFFVSRGKGLGWTGEEGRDMVDQRMAHKNRDWFMFAP